jgi:hypothetical protein
MRLLTDRKTTEKQSGRSSFPGSGGKKRVASSFFSYRDPESINFADYWEPEDEGTLYVPRAGEILYRLNDPPAWARG